MDRLVGGWVARLACQSGGCISGWLVEWFVLFLIAQFGWLV